MFKHPVLCRVKMAKTTAKTPKKSERDHTKVSAKDRCKKENVLHIFLEFKITFCSCTNRIKRFQLTTQSGDKDTS
jgi:hypothetical protein